MRSRRVTFGAVMALIFAQGGCVARLSRDADPYVANGLARFDGAGVEDNAPHHELLAENDSNATLATVTSRRKAKSHRTAAGGDVRLAAWTEGGPSEAVAVASVDEIACRAARRSARVRLLTSEARLHRELTDRKLCVREELSALQQNLLQLQAAHRANEAAGQAAELAWRISEARLRSALNTEALHETQTALQDLRELRDRGVDVHDGEASLVEAHSKALHQEAVIQASAVQASNNLRYLLGDFPQPQPLFELAFEEGVEPGGVDPQAAVAEGLAQRADLNQIRILRRSLDKHSVPIARVMLQQMDPGLGTVTTPWWRQWLCLGDCELSVREAQLALLLDDRKRSAAQEIVEACQDVERELTELAVAERFVAQRRDVLERVESRRGEPNVSESRVTQARLELLEARGEAAHHRMMLRASHAKLKRVQGLWAVECGFLRCRD